MPSTSRYFKLAILAAPIMLTACGEGWEMTRVKDIVPYTMPRTAGTGVAYVRAKMLPKKELNLQPAPAVAPMTTPPPAPPPVTPAPSKAEEVFREQQSK